MAAVGAAAKAAGMSYDAYVKETNPFRGRKGTKPVYSMSLSFPPGDPNATKANMIKAADEVRQVLGMQDHQCLIVQHTDTKHPHVHLIINRVHPKTGKYASTSNDRQKLSDWAHDWEKRHGQVVCPERPHNQEKRKANAERKQRARTNGDRRAKSGYVKNKGLPPSEIAFWNEHGSANLSKVRAARSERQKKDYERYKRGTASNLANVDVHHEAANGATLRRIDRTLRVLKGQAPQRSVKKPASVLDVVFGAMRGAVHGVAARIANRSDVAKLEKTKSLLRDERDVRRGEVMKDRRQALKKMQSIHAWQNWLDEKRCKTYRDSDTRGYREQRNRWDLGKTKPPLFGTQDITFYDVEESKDWQVSREERRKLSEPLEMRPIERVSEKTPEVRLPRSPSENRLPFVKRDPKEHAKRVAEAAQKRAAERSAMGRGRSTGRKRKLRPR